MTISFRSQGFQDLYKQLDEKYQAGEIESYEDIDKFIKEADTDISTADFLDATFWSESLFDVPFEAQAETRMLVVNTNINFFIVSLLKLCRAIYNDVVKTGRNISITTRVFVYVNSLQK